MKCARNMLVIIIIINSIVWTQVIQSVSHEQCTMPLYMARIIAEQEKNQEQDQGPLIRLQQQYIRNLMQERNELASKVIQLKTYIYYGFPTMLILMISIFFLKQ